LLLIWNLAVTVLNGVAVSKNYVLRIFDYEK